MATPEDLPLPDDRITAELRRLATALEGRLAGVATVDRERAEDTGTLEVAVVAPTAEGALPVYWMHSAEDIVVSVGDAPGWTLPRIGASVRTLEAVVESAICGQVEVGKGRGITTYRVRVPDGTVLEDTHEGLVGILLSMPWKPRLRWTTAPPYGQDARAQ